MIIKSHMPLLSPDGYLATLVDAKEKAIKARWMKGVTVEIIQLGDQYGVRFDELPSFQIRDSEEFDATGSAYAIIVTKGLIDFCFSLDSSIFLALDDPAFQVVASEPDFVGALALRWIIAHEFLHGARRHNDKVAQEKKAERHTLESIARGTEYDADLTAAAHIYRAAQMILGSAVRAGVIPSEGSDDACRQIALCAAFAVLRPMADAPQGTSSHPTRATRLFNLCEKLGIVEPMISDPVDAGYERPETKRRYAKLVKCVRRLELQHQQQHGSSHGNLFSELQATVSKLDSSHIAAWADMNSAEISDNRRRFAKSVSNDGDATR